jgi:4-cresol dehydrogenase (hydroxylating)
MDDRKVRILQRLMSAPVLRELGLLDKPRRGIAAIEYIHGLGRGVPSDRGIHGVQWRVTRPEDVGLFWCSPTFPASGDAARRVTRIVERSFAKHRFELPITFTFVTPDRVVATTSCNFNRNHPEEKRRAHALFYELHDSFEAAGIAQYRAGILGQRDITYPEQGRLETLNRLKAVLDPNGVIAPGRYGLGRKDG